MLTMLHQCDGIHPQGQKRQPFEPLQVQISRSLCTMLATALTTGAISQTETDRGNLSTSVQLEVSGWAHYA